MVPGHERKDAGVRRPGAGIELSPTPPEQRGKVGDRRGLPPFPFLSSPTAIATGSRRQHRQLNGNAASNQPALHGAKREAAPDIDAMLATVERKWGLHTGHTHTP